VANQKYCRRLIKTAFNPKYSKVKFCKKVGICPAALEIEDLSGDNNEMGYANEGYTNAKTCQDCVNLVDALKNKELQVNSTVYSDFRGTMNISCSKLS
jgi:hypothetical protein